MDLCSFVTACRKMSAREEKWKHFWYCFFLGGGTGHHHNTYMVSSTHTHTHTHTGTRLHQSCRVFLCRLWRLDTQYYRSKKILLLIFQIAYCYNMGWEGGAQQWREVHSVFWSQGVWGSAARSPVRVWGLAPEAFINVAVCDQALGFTSRTITTHVSA